MSSAKKIRDIGQWIMVLGAILYTIELIVIENKVMTYIILGIFIVSIVLQIIGLIGTRDERRAEREAERAAKEAAKAAKNARRA